MKPPVQRPLPNGGYITPSKSMEASTKAVPTPGAPGFHQQKLPKIGDKGTASTAGDDETARISEKLLARLNKNDIRPRRI